MHTWSAQNEIPIGAIVPAANLWLLAERWYDGRLSPDWKPRPRDASQQLLTDTGFVGAFWSLAN